MTALGDTIAARRCGSIDRDEYWNAMRDCHTQLADYTTLLKASPVQRIELTADGVRLELTDGLRVCWDPTESRTVPTLLLNDGVYELTELLVLVTLAASAQCFIDVGTNIGWYSLNLARAGCRTVHAFEPLPNAYAQLVSNIELNDLSDRVYAVQACAGDRRGKTALYRPEGIGSVAASRRPTCPEEAQHMSTADVITLDGYVQERQLRRVDLIKVDVEGAELSVLQGAMRVLKRDRPALLIELLPKWAAVYGYHPTDVIKLLTGFDYQGFAVGDLRLRHATRVTDDTAEANFLFLPAETVGAATDIIKEIGVAVP